MRKIYLFIVVVLVLFFSCDNDDDNNTQTCTTQGLFYALGNTQITATEANLTTDYFPHNTILGGQSIPAVEIFGNDSNGDFVIFTTEVLTVNATGNANLSIGNGNSEMITVTCLATDTVVGGLMRFQLSGTYNSQPITGEYCVTIDSVNP